MPDTPAVDAGPSPPVAGGNAAPVTPAPTPAPAPAPVSAPTSPTPPPSDAGDLEYDTPIQWYKSDGAKQVVALGELTARYDLKPEISDVDMKQFQLFQRAVGGDAKAGQELLSQGLEAASPQTSEAPDPASPKNEVELLRGEVKDLREQVAGTTPIVSQIQQGRETAMFKGVIEQHKKELPHLAHHPQGAQRVQAAWVEMRKLAAAAGTPLDSHPRAREALAYALRTQENALAEDAGVFRGFDVKTETPPPPGVEAVMPPATPSDGQLPPGAVGRLGGAAVNQYGRPVATPGATGAAMPVPGGIPTPSDRAVVPGHDAGLQPEGPMDPEQFQAYLRRVAAATGGE